MDALEARRIYMINERELDPGRRPSCRNSSRNAAARARSDPVRRRGADPRAQRRVAVPRRRHHAPARTTASRWSRCPRTGSTAFSRFPGARARRALLHLPRQCDPRLPAADVPRRGPDRLGQAYCFKFSRDAELELDVGIMESLIEKMASSLKQRKRPMRCASSTTRRCPSACWTSWSPFSLGKYDSLIPGGRYHNSKDFMSFPSVGPRYLELKPLPPIPPAAGGRGREHPHGDPRQGCVPVLPLPLLRLRDRPAQDRGAWTRRSRASRSACTAWPRSRGWSMRCSTRCTTASACSPWWSWRRASTSRPISLGAAPHGGGIEVIFGIPGAEGAQQAAADPAPGRGQERFYTHIGTGQLQREDRALYTDFSLLTYDQDLGRRCATCSISCSTPTGATTTSSCWYRRTARARALAQDRARDRQCPQGAARGHDLQVQQPR
jgi:polyphosphate kinase